MDVFKAIQERHSVRSYIPDSIPTSKLLRILESARLAPSAANIQPWHFIIVSDHQKREALSKSGMFARFLSDSPVVIVGCGNRKASRWYIVDTTIAMENMVLAATAEELGTCWVGSFDEEHVRKLLKIPEQFSVIAMRAIGRAREESDLAGAILHFFRRRKPLKEIASIDEFGNSYGGSMDSTTAVNSQ